jgi:class 3 adenylate cyclase/tetratricopeptide (TPR) repeat protein
MSTPVDGAAHVGERRPAATIVFADIVGFTSLSEEMDPEDVQALVKGCMTQLRAVVEQYGGTVDKVIGDALMAVFGAPRSLGDDAERAVMAALEMNDCAREQGGRLRGLELRVGVNTGEVMFAPVEEGGRPTVIGDVVNTAQRIQAEAPPGGVLVGEGTRRATSRSIAYEEAAPLVAKGKSRPLRVWRALGVREDVGPYGPMVGRDDELGLIRGAWKRVVADARPHIVTVVGPPGIGKSRLAFAMMADVVETGGRSLRGRAFSRVEGGAYAPFAEQVKQAAGILETDSTDVARQKLDRRLGSLVGDGASEVAGHLAVLSALAPQEVSADKQALFFSVRRFVEALGREAATILVFEDVHWADASQLELIETLAGRLRETRVLLFVLARPELLTRRPGWGGGITSHLALELGPLSAEDSETLARQLLARWGPTADRDAIARVGRTAEGNPLFIEELAATVADRAADTGEALPTSVKEIIAARIDSLPESERAIVLDASVVGRVFWRGALERLGPAGRDLAAALDSLESRDLVHRQGSSRLEGEEEYAFKHVLIRDVAYETLPRSARRERHAEVARYIEEEAGDRVGEQAMTIAHHWREADDSDRAVPYLLRAAELAGRAWAQEEAARLYGEALTLVADDDGARRLEIRLRRAVALQRAAEFGPALAELDTLVPLLSGAERFEALQASFNAAFWSADVERALAASTQARELAEELGDDELRALAHYFSAASAAMVGRLEESAELSDRALSLWPPGKRQVDLVDALWWAGLQDYWRGEYGRSSDRSLAARGLAAEVHNAPGAVNGHAHHGLALVGLGRHEEALRVFENGAALGQELEIRPIFTSRLLNMWGGTLRELLELDEARAKNEEAIELGARIGFPGAQISGRIDLLLGDLAVGDVGRAAAAWPALWNAAEATAGWHQWLWMSRLATAKAEIALAAGRLDDAEEAARGAAELAARHGRLKYVVASNTIRGIALVRRGRLEEAIAALRGAVADAERLRHPPARWRAARALASAFAGAGDDAGAEKAAGAAADEIEAFAVGLGATRRDRFLERVSAADLSSP